MKRFYRVLFVGIALLSGNAFGMQKEVDIRDYQDIIELLEQECAYHSEDTATQTATDYKAFAFNILPRIENFIIAKGKQNEKQYIRLCASYLNRVLFECDPQQVELMFMERFFGDSPLAEFYSMHRQEVIGQLNLDKLNLIMQKAARLKDIDTLLHWLPIFDGTGHVYEQLFADALGAEINKRGLTNGMRSWERNVLQKVGHLQGLGKKFIDPLHRKEQEERNQRQKLRADAENRKDQIIGQLFNALKANQKDQFNALVQDELMGFDAPLADYLDYINNQIERRINNQKIKINNREAILKTWQDTFRSVQERYVAGEDQFWKEAEENSEPSPIVQLEQKRLEEQRQREEQERQRLAQWREEQHQIQVQNQQRQAEELRQRQLEEQSRNRDEQQRLYEEQKRIQREQRNPQPVVNPPQQPAIIQPQQPQQPNVHVPQQPDNPDNNTTQGIAALFASITAPKLVVAAVVVGVCYWGYTKYKAYKDAQSLETSADKEKNNEQAVRTTQSVQKKENVNRKKRVR